MQFWAKKKSKLREKWGKSFEIFRDKIQLGYGGLLSKSGDGSWLVVRAKFLLPGGPCPPKKKNPVHVQKNVVTMAM